MADVFAMLAAEHRLLERLLDELTDTRERFGRSMAAERLNSVLCAHVAFEEIALHPLLRPFANDLDAAAAGEHRQALDVLAELNQAITESSGDAVDTAVTTLRTIIVSHVDHDERHRFPQLRAICDQATIDSLGARLVTMRQQIDTGPWPRA